MPKQNAEVLEVLLSQIADDREVDGVVGEALGVLSQADRCEPLGDGRLTQARASDGGAYSNQP